MMKASELVTAVSAIVLSPDHGQDDILAILNRGLVEVAGGGQREHGNALVAPLPDLFTSDTVTLESGDDFTDMPDDYQRGVYRVEDSSGYPLKKFNNFEEYRSSTSNRSGDVYGYLVKGKKLWVGPAQSSDTVLTVFYHRFPGVLSIVAADPGPPEVEAVDSDVEGILDHLQYRLLVNYAAKEVFTDIEQGLDGQSPDTVKHTALYQSALTDLERFIGPEDGTAVNVGDDEL